VAVARAIASAPRILWADEPTGALDTEAAEVVLSTLRRIVDGGTTLVIVSHDPHVESYADNIVTLLDGRLEGIGSATVEG
jgi:putative ABC transport system ATP-binding protein